MISCGGGEGSSQVPDSVGNGGGIQISTVESPFGFHPASVAKPGYGNNGYGDAQQKRRKFIAPAIIELARKNRLFHEPHKISFFYLHLSYFLSILK
jgi:hypothetical protein